MNGNDTKNYFKNMDGTPWSRWSVGDTLRYDVPAGQIVPDSLQLVSTSGTSPQVILSLGKPMVNIRVNCGDGAYTDKKNNFWSADQQYTPGAGGTCKPAILFGRQSYLEYDGSDPLPDRNLVLRR